MFDKEGQPLYTTAQAAEMLGVSPNTIKNAIQRGVMAYEHINPRLNMVTLEAIETYRRERLGQRGGYRPGAGRRPMPTDETSTTRQQRTFLQEGRTDDAGPRRDSPH